jgi:drug/metabolite transporter (DMT)-like permease
MALHQASGRWRLGLLLALITTACWATLPVALKITLEQLDPITLTWFRFVVATGVMLAWLGARGGLAKFRELDGKRWLWLLLAALMLIGNYVFYLFGVQHTTPGNAQLLIQLAPLLMALGGIFVFREPYRFGQWCGFIVIVCGLGIFFRNQLQETPLAAHEYLLGTGFVAIAALVWAIYALLQKQLLRHLGSPAILLFIYVVASFVLWPMSHPSALLALDSKHWLTLGYCALNTLVAYGAFAEALEHWEASRVSAVFATTPLLSLGVVALVHGFSPTTVASEHIGMAGYLGAVLVVIGSSMSSLLGNKRTA